MDTQIYIESGILELYVMDALPTDERSEVERRAALEPTIAREISEIGEALSLLDRHHARPPRAELRASILDAIDRDATASSSDATVASVPPSGVASSAARNTVTDAASPKVIPFAQTSATPASVAPRNYMLAASWIIVVLSLGSAGYFGLQWRSAADEAEMLREENRQLANANSLMASRAEGSEHAMLIMRSADYHAVQLNGTEHAPTVHPVVYWNPSSREVVLIAKNLPQPPPGKQYQLWAIHDGHRIDAGVFDVDGHIDSMQRLKDIEAAEAFAVTLEQEGGSPVPDLTSIFAVGNL